MILGMAMASFGARIRSKRTAIPLTQQELVDRLADAGYVITQPLVSLIENGKRKPPYRGLIALAQVLQLDLDELLRLAGYAPPPRIPYQLPADVFFRGRDDPEPSPFDLRLLTIEQSPGERYVLYPVESYVSRPAAQIARQEALGRCSVAFWRQRRDVFEEHLRRGAVAYHLHSMPDLLQLDAGRGVTCTAHIVELLRALQSDLRRYSTFHLGLAPASLNLAFTLKSNDATAIAIIAAYPRSWNYRPTTYLEGLCITDGSVVRSLLDQFLAIWHDAATLTKHADVEQWLEDQCARLLSADSQSPSSAAKLAAPDLSPFTTIT